MKKVFIKTLCVYVLIFFVIFTFSVKISGANYTENVTINGNVETEEIWDGVTVDRMSISSQRVGATNQDGNIYNWDAVAISAEKDPAVRIVTWGIDSYMAGNSYKAATTLQIAKDYEKNHPGYTVIAAVNGDFFANRGFTTSAGRVYPSASNEPLNTWIADGESFKSVVMANQDHIVLGFKEDRSYTYHIGSIYGKNYEQVYSDRVYDGTGALRGTNIPTFTDKPIFKINDLELEANVYRQTGILDEAGVNIFWTGTFDNVDVSNYTVWMGSIDRLSIPNDGFSKTFIGRHPSDSSLNAMDYNLDYTHYYLRGRLMEKVDVDNISTVDSNRFYIVTKNQSVLNECALKAEIRVQYELTGAWEDVTSTMGVLFPFLINGKRTGYVSTKGAEYNNNYLNDNKPKPAIGFKADGTCVFFFMGPGPLSGSTSGGPSSIEMAEIMEKLGLVDAFCLDGGGSASILARNASGNLVELNKPTDIGGARSIANAILMVVENVNIKVKEKTSTTVTFHQSEPMADSTLKNATIYVDGKAYPFNGEDVVVEGLTKNTEYTYYVEYTYENNGIERKTKTNSLKFKTESFDNIVQPSDFVITLDENEQGKFSTSITYNANGVKDVIVYAVIVGEEIIIDDTTLLDSELIEEIKVTYTSNNKKETLVLNKEAFQLIVNNYADDIGKPSGSGCSFGTLCLLPFVLACALIVLKRK